MIFNLKYYMTTETAAKVICTFASFKLLVNAKKYLIYNRFCEKYKRSKNLPKTPKMM